MTHTEATREKLSKAAKRRAAIKAKQRASGVVKKNSPAHLAKLRAAAQRRIRNPVIPADGKVIGESPDQQWTMYERSYSNDKYITIKLVAKQPRPTKANFHFGIVRATGCLTRHKDATVMAEYFPTLHEWVLAQARVLCGV